MLNIRKANLIALILLSAACSGESQTIKKGNVMTLSTDPVIEFLSTNKEKIIDLNDRDIGDLGDELFEYVEKKDGFPVSIGLWIVAPTKMNKENTSLLSAYLSTGLRSWEVNIKTNTFLLLRHWKSGKIWANRAYLNAKRAQVPPRSAMGERPDELVATGWHRSANKIDILNRFTNSLPSGNYTITQIYHDKKSNSESFIFSPDEAKGNLTFPKITDVRINDHSIDIKFKKSQGNVSMWNLNMVALKLDEDPIIEPFQVDIEKKNENLTLALPIEKNKWEPGVYQIYIDSGNEIHGPLNFNL